MLVMVAMIDALGSDRCAAFGFRALDRFHIASQVKHYEVLSYFRRASIFLLVNTIELYVLCAIRKEVWLGARARIHTHL